MTWKAEVSDSAVQSTTVLESPSRQKKNEGGIFFPSFARRDRRYAPLYTAFGSARTTQKYLAPALLGSLLGLIFPHILSGIV